METACMTYAVVLSPAEVAKGSVEQRLGATRPMKMLKKKEPVVAAGIAEVLERTTDGRWQRPKVGH